MCWFWKHDWETVSEEKLMDEDDDWIGYVYILKCKKCGIHKRQKFK